MKKFTVALGLVSLVSLPVFAAPTPYTIGGPLNANNNATQNIQVSPVSTTAGVVFAPFSFTVSKGVSLNTAEDTTNNVIKVGSKHYNSDIIFGAITGGGSVAQCATKASSKNTDLTAMPTIDGATGVCN